MGKVLNTFVDIRSLLKRNLQGALRCLMMNNLRCFSVRISKRLAMAVILVAVGFPVLLPVSHQASARQLTVNNELFIEITEMVVPIIQRRRVKGFFSITLAVDCPTMAVSNKVKK